MVEIREAVPSDAEVISELNNSQMGYTFSAEETGKSRINSALT